MATGNSVLKSYVTATQFLEKMQRKLEQQEVLYGLMLGIALRLQAYPERIERPPYLATVTDTVGADTAALMTPPYGLLLYSDQAQAEAALHLLARHLHDNGWTMPTVNGMTPLSTAFAQTWSQVHRVSYAIEREERIFELRKVQPLSYSTGTIRLATLADLDLVTQWIVAFNQEALGEQETDSAATRRQVQVRIEGQTLYLWEDGQPVALAGITRPTQHGMAIGPVYTPPEWRGRGYATSLVAQVSQRLLEGGRQFCTLFTDLANPTSNSIYQKIGYRPVGDYTVYRFTETTPSTAN